MVNENPRVSTTNKAIQDYCNSPPAWLRMPWLLHTSPPFLERKTYLTKTLQKLSGFWYTIWSLKVKLTLNLQLFYLEPMILLVFIYQFSMVFYKIQSLKPEQLDLSQVAPFPRNSAEKNDSIDLT